MRICLSFDVEEFSIPHEYGIRSAYSNSTEFSRDGCLELLTVLKKHGIQSTFFITGYFAEREKEVVRLIKENGHEIASHSYSDADLSALSRKELEQNIKKSTNILKRISKGEIKGFRSPHMSINPHLLEVLESLDYGYDSSVHPAVVPGHYCNIMERLDPYYAGKNRKILEIPVSVIPLMRFPISWLWMRNLGNWISVAGTKANIKKRDVVLYFHPWEFTELPRIKGLPFYITKGTGAKFLKNLNSFIIRFKKYEFAELKSLVKTDE